MKSYLVLLSFLFFLFSCAPLEEQRAGQGGEPSPAQEQLDDATSARVSGFSEKDLRYKGVELRLTRHARERMACRLIDVAEIQEVVDKGKLNAAKSRPADGPGRCPTFAYEQLVQRDKQRIRVIVAHCDGEEKAVVVTVIDLGNSYNCE